MYSNINQNYISHSNISHSNLTLKPSRTGEFKCQDLEGLSNKTLTLKPSRNYTDRSYSINPKLSILDKPNNSGCARTQSFNLK